MPTSAPLQPGSITELGGDVGIAPYIINPKATPKGGLSLCPQFRCNRNFFLPTHCKRMWSVV